MLYIQGRIRIGKTGGKWHPRRIGTQRVFAHVTVANQSLTYDDDVFIYQPE